MPDPQTIRDNYAGIPLATFDRAGNLNLTGTVTTGGKPSLDGESVLPGTPVSGGSGGGVASVTAGDASVTVGGTAANPVIEAGTLDQIANLHPPAANWSNNGKKITSIASGTAAQDAAAFGQLPSAGSPLPLSQGGTGVSEASDAALLAALGAAALAGATFTGAVIPAVVALTDAATIAVNAALGNDFRVTLGGNRTLGTPSNPADGQRVIFQVTQDGTGSRTLAYTSAYEFSTSLPSPTLSTGAGLTDLLGFIYNAAKSKWLFVAFVSGFS